MRVITLCRLDELKDGQAHGFDACGLGRDTAFLLRRGDTVKAYQNSCPHIPGAPMAWRTNQYLNHDGSRIMCSAHGALFDIETGACVMGPCVGESLTPLQVEIDAGGMVSIIDPIAPHPSG